MTAAVVALGLVTAVLSLIVVSLLRSHADILRTLHDAGLASEGGSTGPRARSAAAMVGGARPDEGRALDAEVADLVGTSPTGDVLSVSLTAAPRTLLAFLSSGCLTCRELWDTVDTEGEPGARAMGARLVVVTRGTAEESPSTIADLAAGSVTTILSTDAWEAFGVPVSPYFALVDGRAQRVVGEGAGHSWAQVQRLLGQAVADARAAAPVDGADGSEGSDGDPRVDRRTFLTGRDRERGVDRALLDAGILPGDPSLGAGPVDHPDGDG